MIRVNWGIFNFLLIAVIFLMFSGLQAADYSSYSLSQLEALKASKQRALNNQKKMVDKEKKELDKLEEWYKNKKKPSSYYARQRTYRNSLKVYLSLTNALKRIITEINKRKNKVQLKSVSISGVSSIAYCKKATYNCKAKYSNGTTKSVTAKWSVSNKKYATFSGNVLKANAAGAGKTVTITAVYSGKKVSKKITLKQKAVTLTSVSISGASSIAYCKKATYNCKAEYSNGVSKSVTAKWSVSNNKYATFSGNVLKANAAGAGKTVTITAVYSGKKVSKKITLKPQNAVLKKITISGPSLLYSPSRAAYTCIAQYSNGVTKSVTAKWSVSNNKYVFFNGNILQADYAVGSALITASFGGLKVSKAVAIVR